MNGGKFDRECNCFNSCRTAEQFTRIIELDDRIASLLSRKTKPFDVPAEERFLETSGEGGIRTHGAREGTLVFETSTIGHSVTSPVDTSDDES